MSDISNDSMDPQEEPSKKNSSESVWRFFLNILGDTGIFKPEDWPVKTILSTILILTLIIFALAVMGNGVAHIKENEVGVLADNLRGKLIPKPRVGYHFFIPYLANFYELDRSIQKLNLAWDQGPGKPSGQDIKLKTSDGNNVSLDVTVNYKIIPEKAVEILQKCGTGLRFADILVEPSARHACLAMFGRLSTEELYDAAKRDEMAQATLKLMNEQLMPHGLEVITVIPGEFRFYREYEQVIHEKKQADQEVEEQQAQARATVEEQERQLIETHKKAETRLATTQGDCENKLIQAQAEANKTKRDAEGRSRAMRVIADSQLYTATQQALGRRATLMAEADGMEQLRKSMSGDGGVAMVGLEYTKQLNKIKFSATPVTKQSNIQQFSVQPADAAAATTQHGGVK